MQLVAYGAQDIYLTGNPQITFFKVVYRRHTNFSMETIEQTISGIPSSGGNSTVTISRNGDLVYKIYVTNDNTGVTDGSQMVSEVELEIGGQRIDRHYQEWMDVWNELSTPESKAIGLKSMQGAVSDQVASGVDMVQVPLQFWFCRNPGLALPLIALQYHEVKLKFTWGTSTAAGGTPTCKVWADYIYLDTDERRRFAQVSHEYLIEQLQKDSFPGDKKTFNLNFNHPVKELIWTSADTNVYVDAKLVLNGHDRFEPQEEEYFQLRQPYQYHTNIPGANVTYNNSAILLPTGPIDTGVRFLSGACAPTKAIVAAVGSAPSASITFDSLTTVIPEKGDMLDITFTNISTTDSRGPYSFIVTDRSAVDDPVITVSPSITELEIPDSYGVDDELKIIITSRQKAHDPDVSNLTKKINVYSFALKPEEHQPSGTCNFSRIDNAQLIFNTANGEAFNIYAVNYNVLRIMSGMGGLAYSN